jgi:nucleoside-diphosphate kinase
MKKIYLPLSCLLGIIFLAWYVLHTSASGGYSTRPSAPAQITVERTLSIIKPDSVESRYLGAIIDRFEKAGLRVVGAKMVHLSRTEAEEFYLAHKQRSFFTQLVDFMTSGPVLVMVLEGPNAVAKNRELMGATDPQKAKRGTIRADFAKNIEKNAVHGSDSLDNAAREVSYFFGPQEIFSSRAF